MGEVNHLWEPSSSILGVVLRQDLFGPIHDIGLTDADACTDEKGGCQCVAKTNSRIISDEMNARTVHLV